MKTKSSVGVLASAELLALLGVVFKNPIAAPTGGSLGAGGALLLEVASVLELFAAVVFGDEELATAVVVNNDEVEALLAAKVGCVAAAMLAVPVEGLGGFCVADIVCGVGTNVLP